MAFIVQTYHLTAEVAKITIEGREDALETALALSDHGHVGVRIIGDGRIYNPAEFSLTIPIAEHIEFFDGRSKRRG